MRQVSKAGTIREEDEVIQNVGVGIPRHLTIQFDCDSEGCDAMINDYQCILMDLFFFLI